MQMTGSNKIHAGAWGSKALHPRERHSCTPLHCQPALHSLQVSQSCVHAQPPICTHSIFLLLYTPGSLRLHKKTQAFDTCGMPVSLVLAVEGRVALITVDSTGRYPASVPRAVLAGSALPASALASSPGSAGPAVAPTARWSATCSTHTHTHTHTHTQRRSHEQWGWQMAMRTDRSKTRGSGIAREPRPAGSLWGSGIWSALAGDSAPVRWALAGAGTSTGS